MNPFLARQRDVQFDVNTVDEIEPGPPTVCQSSPKFEDTEAEVFNYAANWLVACY